MGQVNADNPKPHAPAPAPPTPDAPAPSSASLEDRIDSLLSEMQESLDEIDRSTAQAAPESGTQPSAQDEALAAALDDAVAHAEKALGDDQPAPGATTGAPESTRAPAVLDPEIDVAPAQDAEPRPAHDPAPSDTAEIASAASPSEASEPIESLDEKLARQAEALGEEPEALGDETGGTDHAEPAPPPAQPASARKHTTKKPAVAPMIRVPATDSEPEPPAIVSKSRPKAKTKAKIAVRKREEDPTAPSTRDGAPDQGEADARPTGDLASDGAPAGVTSATAPAPAASSAPPSGAPARLLHTMANPLKYVPPHVRDYVGWFALLTAFNAVCVWLFWLLLRA